VDAIINIAHTKHPDKFGFVGNGSQGEGTQQIVSGNNEQYSGV
jgi:hypothetical protein